MNPLPETISRTNSISSADVPLSSRKSGKVGSKGKKAVKAKPEKAIPLADAEVDKLLHNMIQGDEKLYIRILRYEVRP